MNWAIKKILVPTDGSAAALSALEPATDIAAAHGAQVIGLFAYAPYGAQVEGAGALEEIERQIGDASLLHMEEIFGRENISFKKLLLLGNAVDLILETARREEVDLIVMGSRGRTLARRITGSVTAAVVSHAPCAVLSVPKKTT